MRKAGARWRRWGAATRELLDTLLLWEPALKLDANGQAEGDRRRSTTH